MLDALCQKYHVNRPAFDAWFCAPSNQSARDFEEKLRKSVEELQRKECPKHFDFEIKEALKSQQVVQLALRKFCDRQKYELYQLIRNNAGMPGVKRDDLVEDVLERQDEIWKMVFDHLNILLEQGECPYLEFKKAFHKHNFDYNFHCEA
eukprot:CAMPEP_0202965210 /NCGR_PEP_ID=MMETSP1396-20130829/9262_1 /ASSEMBLY_ACC=CAM_ASM_000872 /TAXON_ID= /ORGANISM="Pseudokeronopsis sp., Strain Brazil" /LENGTH=148 /DNA_ID=CAMNT_0049687857 /DNA_START=259 /DNA_END=705 /DNA_ORIENTATION=+